jgi:hypothetical protein
MAETHAEQGHRGRFDGSPAQAEIRRPVGPPRSRRDDDVIETLSGEFVPGRCIVAEEEGFFLIDIRDQVHKVAGKRIVVVDYQRPHRK